MSQLEEEGVVPCGENCGLHVVRPGKTQCNCEFWQENFENKFIFFGGMDYFEVPHDLVQELARFVEQFLNKTYRAREREANERFDKLADLYARVVTEADSKAVMLAVHGTPFEIVVQPDERAFHEEIMESYG